MKKTLTLIHLIIIIIFASCESDIEVNHEKEYLRHVGDIEHDSSTDNINFRICNGEDKIKQYFNLAEGPVYVGEKPSLSRAFKTNYKPVLGQKQNGLIRIRFIVNCKGQADRFRVLQADSNYNETEFDNKVVSQLMEITKGIEEWVILYNDDKQPVDYYNYLIFRITDGQITEILP